MGNIDTSSLPSAPAEVVSCRVGTSTLLPCSWKSRFRSSSLPAPHVQWSMESFGPVLEQKGSRKWTSPDLSDRVEVKESELWSGDCSLVIKDVQVTDGGQYDGYMILDQEGSKTKAGVLLSSVKLLVFDHSSVLSKSPGEDLVLDLHTPHSMSLVFQASNSSEWVRLWQRDVPGSTRLQKDPLRQQLTLKSLTRSDEGIYKVLDENGLTVSSTRLSVVDKHESTSQRFEPRIILRGDAVRHTSIFALSVVVPFLQFL